MKFKRRIYPVTKPRLFRTPTEHVWISDDLLHRALHKFILSGASRRHGSYVPGPLEARRRTAKRRMVNLAEARGGGAIDLDLLAGSNPGQDPWAWRWQSPNLPPQEPAQEAKHSENLFLKLKAVL